jgi:hypothetical protein
VEFPEHPQSPTGTFDHPVRVNEVAPPAGDTVTSKGAPASGPQGFVPATAAAFDQSEGYSWASVVSPLAEGLQLRHSSAKKAAPIGAGDVGIRHATLQVKVDLPDGILA